MLSGRPHTVSWSCPGTRLCFCQKSQYPLLSLFLTCRNLCAGMVTKYALTSSLDFTMPISPNPRTYRSNGLIFVRSTTGAGRLRYALGTTPYAALNARVNASCEENP